MGRLILGSLTIVAVIVATSLLAHASPATPMLAPGITASATPVEPVYYYWNHRRYRHRAWDARRRRWRYY